MKIENWDDCQTASMEMGIPAYNIAIAFGIKPPLSKFETEQLEKLKSATNQAERWKIFQSIPEGSLVEEVAAQAFIDNSTYGDCMVIYKCSLVGSAIERAAIRGLCSKHQ
jgi:hypothetical protein